MQAAANMPKMQLRHEVQKQEIIELCGVPPARSPPALATPEA
jgi:hypothetical protein